MSSARDKLQEFEKEFEQEAAECESECCADTYKHCADRINQYLMETAR